MHFGHATFLCSASQFVQRYFNDEPSSLLLLLLKFQGIDPNIPPASLILLILFIINLLLYILRKTNTPNIATRDTGNGNSKEMIKTIPNNIPNNAIWLTKNCCLLLLFEFNLYSQIPFVTMLILFDVHRSIKNLINNVRLLGLAYSSNSNSNTNNNSSNSSSDNNNQGVMRFTLLAPSASVQQQQQ